eukprot:1161266-Pelagomonas_calceolata.AAC.4
MVIAGTTLPPKRTPSLGARSAYSKGQSHVRDGTATLKDTTTLGQVGLQQRTKSCEGHHNTMDAQIDTHGHTIPVAQV